MFVNHWPVRRKILGVTLILIIIGALIGLVGYWSINRVVTSMDTIYNTTATHERFLSTMEAKLYLLDRTLQAVAMAGSHAEMLEATERFTQALTDIHTTWEDYTEGLTDVNAEIQELFAGFTTKLGEYAALSDEVINGSVVAAMEATKAASATIDAANQLLQQISQQFRAEAARLQAEAQTVQRTAHTLLLALSAGGIVIGVVLSRWVSLSVCSPLNSVVGILDQIAEGQLGIDLPTVSRRDELGHLQNRLREMCFSLREAVASILDIAGSVGLNTVEISAGISQVSASVEEVAATANQFATNVQQVSEHAKLMEEKSQEVTSKADDGIRRLAETTARIAAIDRQAQTVTSSMAALQERSQEIGNIVQLIVDIAAQTNLLALNAAIESARAGEFGRGFAVVAEEVRHLAQQTDAAASRISQLVQDIQMETKSTAEQYQQMVQEVRAGSEAMNVTNQAFSAIKLAIEDMTKRIEQVAAAASEIGSGSQQIASATEEQSAAILSLARIVETLSDNAEKLRKAIEMFKV